MQKAVIRLVDSNGASPKISRERTEVEILRETASAHKKRRQSFPRKVASPTSFSKITIESNTSGFFDWSNSQVMEDVLNNRENFGLL